MRNWVAFIILFIICTAAFGLPTTAQAGEPTEYQVKAAYLYNFVKFVDWPEDALRKDDTLLQICVIGENPFGAWLEEMVSGKTISGRQVSIVYAKSLSQVASYPVVFIALSEDDSCESILRSLEGTATLTISEIDDFAESGGMIGFYWEGQKIRFEIGPNNIKEARLQVSSKLLRLARIVD